MKKYRRIEITAFRRRVTIISGKLTADKSEERTDEGVWLNDADTQEAIEAESAEGRQILTEALRVLEEKLAERFLDKP